MSPYLAPGMRKLPSTLELQMLTDIRNSSSPTSPILTARALQQTTQGISNGQFDQLLQDWQTRGDTKQLNGQAILREGDPRLANLSQTYPSGSKLHRPHHRHHPQLRPPRLRIRRQHIPTIASVLSR
jgi:hypothetical protein